MINAELKRLDTLHAQAEQLAAHLLARYNRSGLHSIDSQKLKKQLQLSN